jgi:hypothetical protein
MHVTSNAGHKAAMKKIFENTGVNYWFMDEEGGICCGRPMMLAGHTGRPVI